MANALSVGTVFSEEQAQATVERIADQLRTKKTPREFPLMIANIVSTFSVGIPSGLDLAVVAIALNGRLGEWKVKTQDERGNAKDYLRGVVGTDQPFQSCVSRCRETRTTNSIFSSSQVVVGGAKSVLLARLAATLIAAKLYKSLGLWTGVYNFRVQNVVTSFGLGYYLNLPYFYHHHSLYSTWSEAEFRGLTYKVGDATFVIFETGNAVLTGEKSFESLEAAYRTALPIFERYKRGAEKMYIEPSKLLKPEVKESEKHNSSKQRKEKLKAQTYKRVEEDYVERIRAANEAERKRVNPAAAAAEEAEQKRRPAKRRRVRYQQDPSNSDRPETVTSEPHRVVQRQWKTQIALTPVAPFQPKYQDRQAPPTYALRKAMSKGSQLDAAKDQVKKERMKMENPPVHVQK